MMNKRTVNSNIKNRNSNFGVSMGGKFYYKCIICHKEEKIYSLINQETGIKTFYVMQ